MKTLIGFALGTMLSLGAMGAASAAGTSVAAPAPLPAGIEVIVVTAKRTVAQADTPIEEIVVTAKRPSASPDRIPPVMTIEMPKIDLAVGGPPVVRL